MKDNKIDSTSYQVTVSEISDREIVEIIIRRIPHKDNISIEAEKNIFEGC